MKNIVHIGYHKTASTWFQKVFYPSVSNLCYVDRKKVLQAFYSDTAFTFDVDKARSLLCGSNINNKSLILCEESLSGSPHNGGLNGLLSKEIACRIKQVMPDSRIVVFVRNQIDMIASAYRQYVKEGGTFSVDAYLHPYEFYKGFMPEKFPCFTFEHFRYVDLIKFYIDLFGRENVHVFLYEDLRKDNELFIEKFIEELRLDIAKTHKQVQKQKPNPSYSDLQLAVGRFLNLFTYKDTPYKRYLFRIEKTYPKLLGLQKRIGRIPFINHFSSSAQLLGEKNLHFIKQYYEKSNLEIKNITGISLDNNP